MNVSAIIPAAGKSRRFDSKTPKLFVKVGGKPVLFYTLKNISGAFSFLEIIIASDPFHFKTIEKIISSSGIKNARLVRGGATRAESVRNGLLSCSEKTDWVLVHDAARPLVSREVVRRALKAAQGAEGAVSALPATATVKRVKTGGAISGTEDRNTLWLAQTPQIFKKKALIGRYKKLGRKSSALTDEAAFFDGTGANVRVALGAANNFKITTPEDIELFRFYLSRTKRG